MRNEEPTPGPWTVRNDSDLRFQRTIHGPDGCHVATTYKTPADADIVASSRELHDAAHAVLRMLDYYGFGQVPAREVEALREAVTKGLGE